MEYWYQMFFSNIITGEIDSGCPLDEFYYMTRQITISMNVFQSRNLKTRLYFAPVSYRWVQVQKSGCETPLSTHKICQVFM